MIGNAEAAAEPDEMGRAAHAEALASRDSVADDAEG
jgi:hypothetical protein